MKRLITAGFLILGFIICANGQSKSDKIYDILSNMDGVTHFSFSKNMVDAIDLDLGEDDEERNVSGDLHRIRFMSYNPEKGDLSGSKFIKKAIGLLPAQYKKYEEKGDDDDSDTEIWLLGKNKKYKECHVFLKNEKENQRRFIVSFYGDFTVNDLDKLKKKGKEFSED